MHRTGAAPLLHGSVLVVAGDPLAGWPSQAGLLLQSSILFVVQLLQLSSPSLLAHLCHVKDSFRGPVTQGLQTSIVQVLQTSKVQGLQTSKALLI